MWEILEVFFIGCIVFELISGRGPFRKRGEKVPREDVDNRVKNDKENYGKEFTEEFAKDVWNNRKVFVYYL